VDWPGFQESVRRDLERAGLEPQADPVLPGRWLLPDARCWIHLDLESLLDQGLWAGMYPEEIGLSAVGHVQQRLGLVQRVVDLARRLVPQGRLDLDPERGLVHVHLPQGAAVELHLDRVLASPEGPERSLRFALSPEARGLEVCRCGEPSHLAVKLRSPSWLASLPAEEAAGLVCRPVPGPPQVFVRECTHHVVPLRASDLVAEGLSLEALQARVERDLDRTGGCFRALVVAQEGRWGAAFLGPDVASLVCHPGLVAGACEAASLGLPERVRVRVPDLNLLVVWQPDLPAPRLEALIHAARAALLEDPGSGGGVDLRVEVVRTAPRGRLVLEGLKEVLV